MLMFLVSFTLFGCSEDPTIGGTVKDIWNKPVEGVSIMMEGVSEEQVSNSSGSFSFIIPQGKEGTLRFRATHNKYLYDVEMVSYSKDAEIEETPSVDFSLYPKPDNKGFFGIGSQQYLPLSGKKTRRVATKLESYYGLADVGSTLIISRSPKFVFHTTLRKEEIKQIDLHLYQLNFKEKEVLKGILGETAVEIDLWIPKEMPIDFSIKSLDQDEMFLLEFNEDLAEGLYAFSTRDVLGEHTPGKETTLPKELQVAYPFEIK
jgi:hypothetical protein